MNKSNTLKGRAWLLASVVSLLLGCSEQETASAPLPLRPVSVITLEPTRVSNQTTFPGQLQAVESSTLSFRVPGQLVGLYAHEGQQVSAGQLLADLDQHDFQLSVEELQARLDEAQAARDQARSEFERVKRASQGDAVAAVDLDRARTALKRSEAAVTTVQKNLQRAQDALGYTQLVAPYEGVIAKELGHQFTNVMAGEPVYTLHQLDQLEVKVDVPEHWLPELKIGDKAQVQVTAFGDQQFEAQISAISNQASVFSNSYLVTLVLNEQPEHLYPDMSARVTLTSRKQREGYWLPHTALTERDGEAYVLVIEQGVAHKRPVSVKAFNAEQVLLDGPLANAEQVVASGVHFIEPGQPVGKLLTVDPVALKR